MEFKYVKLETYIPETHLKDLQKALQEADAGHIGNYDSCMSYSRVTGTWRALDGANPYIGAPGEISEELEIKVEVTLKFYREYLYDAAGEPLFCFSRHDTYDQGTVERRFYYKNRQTVSAVPEGDGAEWLPRFDRIRALFQEYMAAQ